MLPENLVQPDVGQVWQRASASLKLRLSPAMFSTWIASCILLQIDQDQNSVLVATISCPSAFHATNIEKNFNTTISEILTQEVGRFVQILYVVGTPTSKANYAPELEGRESLGGRGVLETNGAPPSSAQNNNFIESRPPFVGRQLGVSPRVQDLFSASSIVSAHEDRMLAIARKIGLRTDYTFENFAVSGTNEMAHAAATAVAARPGEAYNPLFLYGGVGVGKTHLMHAIANDIISKNPSAAILYCTGEEFTNEIVGAIQNKRASVFKQKYRSAKVFFVDDVQFIAGKNAVQEEFFHTFNALVKQGCQVVLTSDRPPHEITLLEDRLRSRFEAGLMIDIGQPTFELRTAIFLVKAAAAHLQIPIDLAKAVAAKVDSARKIEGIITSIRSEIELKHRELSPALIEDVLRSDAESKRPPIKARPADIIKTVSDHFHIKQTALKGKRRVKNLVEARHIAMFLMKKELSLSLVEIGQWFSGRDHTSVLHAVNKIEIEMKENIDLQQNVSALRMSLAAV